MLRLVVEKAKFAALLAKNKAKDLGEKVEQKFLGKGKEPEFRGGKSSKSNPNVGKSNTSLEENFDYDPTNVAAYEKYKIHLGKREKNYFSSQQLKEEGVIIAGATHKKFLKDEPRLISQYGGGEGEWVKKSSSSFQAKDGQKISTHWYEHLSSGKKVEFKTKIE